MRANELYSRMAMVTLGLALGMIIGVFGWTWFVIFPGLLVPLSIWFDEKSVKFRNGVDYE